MITWTVKTEKNYPVVISDKWSALNVQGQKVCVVTDDNVEPLYLQDVVRQLEKKQVYSFVIASGEQSKNAQNYLQILSFLAQNQFTRKDSVIALGGGVVGDLAGFAASTYMRGISFYQVPTTLLAMTDSCLGGKTAINLPEGKNLAGTFCQPDGVFVNVETLKTLPAEEMLNGWGEVTKYAFLSQKIARMLAQGATEQLVCECLKLKSDVVARDERESGCRTLLNLGHTVGHAVEALSRFALPHGVCVAKGIAAALKISQKYYCLDDEWLERTKKLIDGRFDLSLPFDKNQIILQIAHDKKSVSDGINFVMIRDVGDCRVEKLDFAQLEKLL